MDWICKYCGFIAKSRRKLAEHHKECEAKNSLQKDSLGRVIAPGQHDAMIRSAKERAAAGKIEGHKHSFETRQHLSEIRQKWLEENHNHGCKWFLINGIKVQGTWEKKFAEYLNANSIEWKRQKIPFKKTHQYTPDFYCPEQNVYFEVKGFRRDRDIYKMYLVLSEHPELQIKMIERNEIMNLDEIDIFSLPNFNELYKLEDIDKTKFVDVWK
jgi:hypothetical protein